MGRLLAGHDAQVTVLGWIAVVVYLHRCICTYDDIQNSENEISAIIIIIEFRKQTSNNDDSKLHAHDALCCLHVASSMRNALNLPGKESICVCVSEKEMPLLSQRCSIFSSVSVLFGISRMM